MTKQLFLAASLILLVALSAIAPAAEARVIRIDRQMGSIPGADLANDGSVLTQIRTQEEDMNGVRFDVPFSINFFGTVYDSFYVNENGTISFGAPFSGTPRNTADLLNTGVPVIAAFFADADMTADRFDPNCCPPVAGQVNLAFTFGINMFINFQSTYQGSTSLPTLNNTAQIALFGSTTSNDFRLELNYDAMEWESGDLDGGTNGLGGIAPRIGFSNGFGVGFETPGSGMNGTLLSSMFPGDCVPGDLRTGCNDYFYEFINGVPYQNGVPLIPTMSVAEPALGALFAFAGLALLGRASSRKRGGCPQGGCPHGGCPQTG